MILKPSTPTLSVGSKKAYVQRFLKSLSQSDDHECAMIDATIVRAHQHSACSKKENNQGIGRFAGDSKYQNSCTV
ncbi:hypothetical protein P618_200498 [Holospora obtusa F1]|uniref:Transposase n=1 Tax=Holospora obtusa F1 TaxID=1399147 RepID=W6TEP5_HOLOB|nr:hypothetical protein P618_200498 [Holospora obtusa F1]